MISVGGCWHDLCFFYLSLKTLSQSLKGGLFTLYVNDTLVHLAPKWLFEIMHILELQYENKN